ncbi:uncharacterized protein LOC131307189 [Rhododendron vialii]|uniref:uncharacterized protein LOC131307189 n=1 Tax=Rhododendron vialii TaxID=182163 RepID=UPI00265FBF4B|nr:uncharacterized protein LOC131307189 [Rhododendron vialii]
MKHASARNVVERTFGILKARWAILRSHSYFPIRTQCRIITACCLLHNFITCEMPNDPFAQVNDNQQEAHETEEDEFIDVVEAINQWSEWRTTLATQMFNEWQANRAHGNFT